MSLRPSAVLLLLCVCARAEPVPGSFHGLTLSLGSGRPVCAKVTFDRKTAEAGGRILILDAAGAGDEQAIRLSEAVVIRRGGLSSRAGAAARRHGVPAVALGRGRWDGAAPALYLDEPSYGNPQTSAGFSYRPVIGSEERALREGDAVIVDASKGQVTLVPPSEAESRTAAAEAARAFDGLRDAQALEQWLAQSGDEKRGAALLEELVPRAAEGLMSADDLARVRRAAERALPASARENMRRTEASVFTRAAREARARAEDCLADAKEATDSISLERLAEEARAAASGLAGAARLMSLSDGGSAAAARDCADAASKRAKSRAGKRAELADVAAAAGADRPEGVELPAGSWASFVESNGLKDWLSSTVDDASLGLRRKSERIRERVQSGRLGPVAGVNGPSLIVGEDAALRVEGPAEAPARIKEAWAASWGPGPLGERLRAGRALAYVGRVRIEKIAAADASGTAFSRDPGSGRRERVFVEAASGSLDGILSGDAALEAYTLDRRTGRELAPRTGAGAAALTPDKLARVARLARALDAWKGAGVEFAFSFSGARLLVHHARSLEAPRPVVPLNDPFAPRPEAGYLNLKAVAR
ncbi:MAG: hypothetical protein HY923_06710 [Elusimicrobia bacterium]|nr:hypothetical protein [Elusimicrobiota bacterium]